jgi:signal transduction histidine kinase
LSNELKEWLERNSLVIQAGALRRAPNMLPDVEEVADFLGLLQQCIELNASSQLRHIQAWALKEIGPDTAVASDWVTLLRAIKEAISDQLTTASASYDPLDYWRQLDHIFNYALIEAARLASDRDRVTLLEHMVDLRRQMDRLNRSKASFVQVAAHELKTPLTVLEGYANMLKADLPADKPHLGMYLDGLNNGTRRLREIIADMVDAAMIDSQQFVITYQQLFPEKIVHLVASSLAEAYRERDVTLNIERFVFQEAIFGDPERLYQAFYKILINALKYTPDGGCVNISTILTRPGEISDEIAGFMNISVADAGIGINPEDLELIFERFSRTTEVALHSTSKTKFKGGGPGLGLPIARGIIEAHGGRIWAESAGCDERRCPGATFHVELPLRLLPPQNRR